MVRTPTEAQGLLGTLRNRLDTSEAPATGFNTQY